MILNFLALREMNVNKAAQKMPNRKNDDAQRHFEDHTLFYIWYCEPLEPATLYRRLFVRGHLAFSRF